MHPPLVNVVGIEPPEAGLELFPGTAAGAFQRFGGDPHFFAAEAGYFAQPLFGLPVTVPERGIEVAQAFIEGVTNEFERVRLRDIGDMHSAEA